ncbi:hypothetical protein KY290_037597 [Solanum tuberosum]|uniref:Uncharacterized protein n=1 Tax=Solanum tuberosum TaxID=4113 RepID=A0ABQ7TW02_SOLTU|nr:hypothetical protein KY290_037597 [Solanum tuberosum]
MRKVIAVDGTFLRSKYEGVLLSAVAQDAENHIFPVASKYSKDGFDYLPCISLWLLHETPWGKYSK